MNPFLEPKPFIAIACGGTGGHLFPGVAVAEALRREGATVALLISPKDVDQQAVKSIQGVEILTLPAVGLQNRNYFSFAWNFAKSFRLARKKFRERPPQAVLAMGGFTSAPPILAGKATGARTFLHESNLIPGRANRFLAHLVDEAFVGFSGAATRLRSKKVTTTGTPVRYQLRSESIPSGDGSPFRDPASCRKALGLDPNRPTLLIVGGSQGASGLNELMLSTLPRLAGKNWQWLHLTGKQDFERVKAAYAALGVSAVVKPFLAEMDLALGAAAACVSRAGASSLAELAAFCLPALLVPFPAAADNHQFFNADAFAKTGAAKLVEQKQADPERVATLLIELVENSEARLKMQAALAPWHAPAAATRIAENILRAIARNPEKTAPPVPPSVGRTRLPGPIKAVL
jgi:UDP-N-acetylglucosamine--N-acetylmuramyl-(pentapeptide) pyrophosphoryl-undecaprenol N-acetylglucosamine transferase